MIRQQRDEQNEALGKWDSIEVEGIVATSRKELHDSLNKLSKAIETAEAGGKGISNVFTFIIEDFLENLDVVNNCTNGWQLN